MPNAWPCSVALLCQHSQCMLKSYAVHDKGLGANVVQGHLLSRHVHSPHIPVMFPYLFNTLEVPKSRFCNCSALSFIVLSSVEP